MKKFLLLNLFICTGLLSYAQREISGTVIDEDGQNPLPGVNVIVKGTVQGTVTDFEGKYTISVPGEGAVLVFSYVGYNSEEINIGNQTVIDLSLIPDISTLGEVVVVGYGTSYKKEVTGSIASIKADEIQNISVGSMEGTLQGRVTGAQFTTTSGELGGGVSIQVRGPSSINASNQPLIIVDGMPISQNVGAESYGAGNSPGQSPFLNINPNDIASVEILKDAAASSIYGSRGANGVVLITTKRGGSGKTNIDFGYYAGFQNETNRYEMLNGPQYSHMFNDAGINFVDRFGYVDLLNSIGFPGNAEELWFNDNAMAALFGTGVALQNHDSAITTDWLDQTHRTGFVQEFNLGINGGNDKTRFYVGGTYRDEDGFLITNNLKRLSMRANVDHQISKKVRLEVLLNPSRVSVRRIAQGGGGTSPIFWSGTYYPNVPAYDENGNLNESIAPNRLQALGFSRNPIASVNDSDVRNINTRFFGGINFAFEPAKGLVIRAEHAIDFFDRLDSYKFPVTTLEGAGTNGTSEESNLRVLNWNLNYTAAYNKTWGAHQLKVLLGASFQEESSKVFSASNNDFVTTDLMELTSAGGVASASGSRTGFAFNSFFGRINYMAKNRYLLMFTARYDGSSKFGKDNRYGFFPGVSAGWIMSEEPFLSNSSVVSFLKLRGSYGETGNANGINNFASLGLVSTGANYNFTPGLLPTQLGNPDLKWETNRQLDIGFDIEFFKGRLKFTMDYYRKKTVDMLLNAPLPATTGFLSINQNLGEMVNRGFEFDLRADVINTNNFQWTLGFNLTTLQNEVTKLPNGEDIILGRWIIREGETLGSWYLVDYAGVDQSNGNAVFFDLEGEEGAWDPNNRIVAGNPLPDYYGGFINEFRFKGFDLNVFFQYSEGSRVFVQDLIIQGSGFAAGNFNHQLDQLNYWTPENTDTDIPAPVLFGGNGTQTSTRFLQDASYIRLKTLSLGYSFPRSMLKVMDLRIFAQAQNLWTITDFKGLDPEVSAIGADTFLQGDSFYTAPMPRTITFGFNMSF